MSFPGGNIKKIVSRGHTLILTEDGYVYGTGYNALGALGFGDTVNRNVFEKIPSLSGVVDISAGGNFSCFLMSDGTVKACGTKQFYGAVESADLTIPSKVIGLSDVKHISCGSGYVLYTKTDGTVYGTGRNNIYQLGLADKTTKMTPTLLSVNNVDHTEASITAATSLFFIKDKTIYGCGANENGCLGIGDGVAPTPFELDGSWDKMTNGSLFLLNGAAYSCGFGSNGQLGYTATKQFLPRVISGLGTVKDIFSNQNQSLFLLSDNTVKACGWNFYGQLGTNDSTNRTTPIVIASNVKLMGDCGGNNLFFVQNDGSLIASGNNESGQLGLGDNTDRKVFTAITVVKKESLMVSEAVAAGVFGVTIL